MYIRIYIYPYIHIYICVYIYQKGYVYVHVHVCVYIYIIIIYYKYIKIYIYIYIHIHAMSFWMSVFTGVLVAFSCRSSYAWGCLQLKKTRALMPTARPCLATEILLSGRSTLDEKNFSAGSLCQEFTCRDWQPKNWQKQQQPWCRCQGVRPCRCCRSFFSFPVSGAIHSASRPPFCATWSTSTLPSKSAEVKSRSVTVATKR